MATPEDSKLFRSVEAWLKKNPSKTIADWKKETEYTGPALKKRGRAGQIRVSYKGQSAQSDVVRKARLEQTDIDYINTLKQSGLSTEEAQAMLAASKAKVRSLSQQVTQLNKDKGSMRFSLGHETAVEQGGGDFARNVRLERGKGSGGNFARSSKAEIDPSVKPVLGIPSSGREAAIMDVSKEFDLPLTPKDRQAIKANPAAANDIITQRFQQLESFATKGVLKFVNGAAKFMLQTTGSRSTPEDLEVAPWSEQLGFKPIDTF